MGKEQTRILTNRDREILRFTGQGGVATVDQLKRRFWPNGKPVTCLARLREMVKAGWLENHRVGIRSRGEQAFTLTPAGAAFFSRGEHQGFILGLPSRAELKQQLLLQEARLVLEKELAKRGERALDWKNERALRSLAFHNHANSKNSHQAGPEQVGEIADAAVTVAGTNGGEYRLELEIDGVYQGKMLEHKLKQLSQNHPPVIWVTTTARAERLRKAIAPYPTFSLLVIGE